MNPEISTQKISPIRGKSIYKLRFIVLLWAIFLSVLINTVTPITAPQHGYKPVYSYAQVLGANTSKRSEVKPIQKVAFISQEIISEKVPSVTPTPQTITTSVGNAPGKSRQIGEYTWTIDVPDDERAGTREEILDALNAYRQRNGRGSLSLDGRLSSFAQTRASLFASRSKTDSHAGFMDYLNNQDGFTKLGFAKIGENSSFGYKVSASHLIEWVYAGDSPHDTNQLSAEWTQVGIGVSETSTNIIFAGRPL